MGAGEWDEYHIRRGEAGQDFGRIQFRWKEQTLEKVESLDRML